MTIRPDIPKYVSRGTIPGRKMNPEYVALWESYLDEGMAFQHVGELFGVDGSTVRRHYPDKGWTPDQARELGLTMKNHNRRMKRIQASYA